MIAAALGIMGIENLAGPIGSPKVIRISAPGYPKIETDRAGKEFAIYRGLDRRVYRAMRRGYQGHRKVTAIKSMRRPPGPGGAIGGR